MGAPSRWRGIQYSHRPGAPGCAFRAFEELSSDGFGQILRQSPTASKVDTALSVKNDHKTTLAFVHIEDADATYSLYDEASALRLLLLRDIPPLPGDVTALFLSGIPLTFKE